MRYLLLIVAMLNGFRLRAENEHPKVEIPTPSDVGGVFLKTLIMSAFLSPPESISIYPVLYERDGERHAVNSIFIVISGDDVNKFYELLIQPTRIGQLVESTPNIIVESGSRDLNRVQLRGNLVVDKDLNYVVFRLLTGNPFCPTADFVYNDKMKKFLLDRQVKLDK